ncbi:hypothetical protein VPHK439_0049 [Vibrio phage K439]
MIAECNTSQTSLILQLLLPLVIVGSSTQHVQGDNMAGVMAFAGLFTLPFEMGEKNKKNAESVYEKEQGRNTQIMNAQNEMQTQQENIFAAEQNEILQGLDIQVKQAQANAQAKVEAATVGAEGAGVEAVQQSTRATAVQARSALEGQTDAMISQSLDSIYGAAYDLSLLNMPPFESDAAKKMNKMIFGAGGDFFMAGVAG